jgi:hypothetical protein
MQNRETFTIAIRGETKWQTWANEIGIDLELPPSHIYKPTGLIKRTGKKVQEKGLRIIQDANLPKNLWLEAVPAAAYLYNISPSGRLGYRTPNEIFNNWFQQYFRWYTPKIVRALTVDLRPD